MESVGGELNAYTTKELTLVYTIAPAGHTDRALELIADLIKNSVFPPAETERERDIIIEEIHSYADSPSDSVFDEFDELLYDQSSMAHNILGSTESVRTLTGPMARAFLEKYYVPSNMALYCVDADPVRALRRIEKHFGDLNFPKPVMNRLAPSIVPQFMEERHRDHSQANTIIGCRIPGRDTPLRHALMLFNNILGGPALNSLLCQQIRERRGLVYSIESNVVTFSDCGTFYVYFGSDRSTVKRCERLVKEQIDRLAQGPLSPRAFDKVRSQYCGQLSVLADNRENDAMALGRTLLLYDKVYTLDNTIEAVRQVTPESLLDAARLVASQPLSRLTLT